MMVVTVRKVPMAMEQCAILGTGQWPDSSRLGAYLGVDNSQPVNMDMEQVRDGM